MRRVTSDTAQMARSAIESLRKKTCLPDRFSLGLFTTTTKSKLIVSSPGAC